MPVLCPGPGLRPNLVTKLHSDSSFHYYKVSVASGVRMGVEATRDTCRQKGMQAACKGPRGCNAKDGMWVATRHLYIATQWIPGARLSHWSLPVRACVVSHRWPHPYLSPINSYLHRPSVTARKIQRTVPSWREFSSTHRGKGLFKYYVITLGEGGWWSISVLQWGWKVC